MTGKLLLALLSVAAAAAGAAPQLTHSLDRDYWLNVPGGRPEDLVKTQKYRTNQPDGSDQVRGRFMALGWKDGSPKDWGAKFGEKIYGYLVPAATAEYVFWICSDDGAAVLLSENTDPDRKKVIVRSNYAPLGQWKFKSKPVKLEKDKPYYIEFVHKQSEKGTHAMVGWTIGNADPKKVEIIPADYLSSYKAGVPK